MKSSTMRSTVLLLASASIALAQTSALGNAGSAATSAVGSAASRATGGSSATSSTASATSSAATSVAKSFAQKHSGLSKGALAGVVVGSVIGGLLILGLLIGCCCCGMFKKGNKKADRHHSKVSYDSSVGEKLAPAYGVERTQRPEPVHHAQPTTPALERGNPTAERYHTPQDVGHHVTPSTATSAVPAASAATAMSEHHSQSGHETCGAHCDNCARMNQASTMMGGGNTTSAGYQPAGQSHIGNQYHSAGMNSSNIGSDAYQRPPSSSQHGAPSSGYGYADRAQQLGTSAYESTQGRKGQSNMDNVGQAIESGAKRQNQLHVPGAGRM